MSRRLRALPALVAGVASAFLGGAFASAQGPAPAAVPALDGGAPASVHGCVETAPRAGLSKPILVDAFPQRGPSGYAAVLEVKVFHQKGETVLPSGLDLQKSSEAMKELKLAGFVFPHQDGSAAANVQPQDKHDDHPELALTILTLPLLALPEGVGRHVLVLPRLPVAVARASGEIVTLCTHEHSIIVDDPTAQTPDPAPVGNPAPRRQREEWTALREGVKWGLVGVAIAIAAAFAYRAYRKWRDRPKPVPPPPRRPPWEVALERLESVREDNLLEQEKFDEYFDRVSDAVREYVGARYGFDGLESTTDEIIGALENGPLSEIVFKDVVSFLRECDLVKFAKAEPSAETCGKVLGWGESIVRSTMPKPAQRTGPPGHGGGPTGFSGGRRSPEERERRR